MTDLTAVPDELETTEPTDAPDSAPEPAVDPTEAWFAAIKGGVKTTRVHFRLSKGGPVEWADLVGMGMSADDMAAVRAFDAGAASTDDAEAAVRRMARIIANMVVDWSFAAHVAPTYEALCGQPDWFLGRLMKALVNADRALPLDRRPKGKGKKKS